MHSITSLVSFIASIILLFASESEAEFRHKSRAVQNFGCNCLFNDYIQEEFNLGLHYLNVSNYMFHDSVAMKGFGKMFQSFWHEQIENANTLRKYVIKRGGLVETKSYKLNKNSEPCHGDCFANQTVIVDRALSIEKELNNKLHELHRCSTNLDKEKLCRDGLKKIYKHRSLDMNIDPHTASFLDGGFVDQKVSRIKYLADLHQKITRFDLHLKHSNQMVHIGLNPIGVHIIDSELESKY